MEKKELPRLAFFSFTCCEGCQLVVLSCEDELPDILSLVKIVNFTRAIDEIIQVDYYLHGCPISKKEFLNLTTSLLLGKRPDTTNHPVCVDCKMAGNTCVFEKDMTCVGPITRAGCDAICVTYGAICWGCRGLVDNPNTDAHAETLKRHGLTADAVMRKFSLYGTCKTRKC